MIQYVIPVTVDNDCLARLLTEFNSSGCLVSQLNIHNPENLPDYVSVNDAVTGCYEGYELMDSDDGNLWFYTDNVYRCQ